MLFCSQQVLGPRIVQSRLQQFLNISKQVPVKKPELPSTQFALLCILDMRLKHQQSYGPAQLPLDEHPSSPRQILCSTTLLLLLFPTIHFRLLFRLWVKTIMTVSSSTWESCRHISRIQQALGSQNIHCHPEPISLNSR